MIRSLVRKNGAWVEDQSKAPLAKFHDSRKYAYQKSGIPRSVTPAKCTGNAVKELEALRLRNYEIEEMYQQRAWSVVIAAYALALDLRNDESIWTEFINHPQWQKKIFPRKPKSSHQHDPFKWVAHFVAKRSGPTSRQQASKLRRVLEFLATNAVHPSEAKKCLLRNGGIDKIYEHSRKKQRHPASPAVTRDVVTSQQDTPPLSEDEKPALAGQSGKGATKTSRTSKSPGRSNPPTSPPPTIRVRSPKKLGSLIEKEVAKLNRGQSVAFEVVKNEVDGRVTFEVTIRA